MFILALSMNLDLLESFGQNYPEEFDGSLDSINIAVTCSFNKHGTLLAVGCNDGRVVIWDFLTRGVAKVITAHNHPVCSVSWSRNGHKLVSASTDNTVCIWEVITSECEYRYRFPSPVLKVQFHPRSDKTILVCPMKHAAVVINVEKTHSVLPLDDEFDTNIFASFDRKGTHIFTGNAKGKILIFTTANLELKASFRVTTGTSNSTSIKSIEFARRADCFLVNTADRIIRVYESSEVLKCGKNGDPEPKQKLQDLVNKTTWKKCVFSGNGEYICAGSARQHSLYIWERSVGNLVKILHGTKGELLLDLVWHPVRPIITSISSGVVSVWAQPQVENWSAFAPDFKELDENVEYDERESEFDIEDEDRSPVLHPENRDIDEEVDVVSVEPITAFCSSDEDTEDTNALLYLPITPEIEEPEEGWPSAELPVEEQAIKKPVPISEPSSNKKRKTKVVDIILECAPKDEMHPLLNSKCKEKAHPLGKKATKSKFQKTITHGDNKITNRPKYGNRSKEKTVGDQYSWKEFEDF